MSSTVPRSTTPCTSIPIWAAISYEGHARMTVTVQLIVNDEDGATPASHRVDVLEQRDLSPGPRRSTRSNDATSPRPAAELFVPMFQVTRIASAAEYKSVCEPTPDDLLVDRLTCGFTPGPPTMPLRSRRPRARCCGRRRR